MNESAMALGSVFAVHALAMFSPGPNVLVVTQAALGGGRRSGVCTALGISAGTLAWASAALFGLSVVLAQAPGFANALTTLGGAYLVYLGVRLWRHARHDLFAAQAPPGPAPARGDLQAFRTGLLTNLLVFFGSVFAALLPATPPTAVRLGAIAIVTANAIGWHVALACLFSTPRARMLYGWVKPWVDRTAGSVLIALGARLLMR